MKKIQIYLFNANTPDGRFLNKSLIPIIVTNANLFLAEYSYADLDSNGDLKDCQKIESISYLAYNYPQILKWDINKQIVRQVGNRNTEDSEHLKTIFIVNIEKLKQFIDVLLLQEP